MRAEDNYRHDAIPLLSWVSWLLVSSWKNQRWKRWGIMRERGGVSPGVLVILHSPSTHPRSTLCSVPCPGTPANDFNHCFLAPSRIQPLGHSRRQLESREAEVSSRAAFLAYPTTLTPPSGPGSPRRSSPSPGNTVPSLVSAALRWSPLPLLWVSRCLNFPCAPL